MKSTDTAIRQTKYCTQIEEIVRHFGHASNAQILHELHHLYPEISATTVHRATARLASRGKISIAPNDRKGAMRYDANIEPHDHFLCSHCGILKDVDIANQVTALLAQTIAGCGISGRITISGTCKACQSTYK